MSEGLWNILEERTARHAPTALAGHQILLIQHVLDDLLQLVTAFTQLGCQPADITIVGIPYSSRESAAQPLRELGCTVHLPTFYPMEGTIAILLNQCLRTCKEHNKKLLIVEDGGYAVRLASEIERLEGHGFLEEFLVGAVEQTSRGSRLDKELEGLGLLDFPVVTVAECNLKHHVEPPYIALALARNLDEVLGHLRSDVPEFELQKAAIFGFGSIGSHLARHFNRLGVAVYVRDPRFAYQVASCQYAKSLTDEALRECDLVIGCTGHTSIHGSIISEVKTGGVLASASSRRIEIDIDGLFAVSSIPTEIVGPKNDVALQIPAARRVNRLVQGSDSPLLLLYDGYPLNFWGTSLPDYVSAAVMSLLLEGALALAAGGLTQPRVYSGSEVLESEELDILNIFIEKKPADGVAL